MRYLLVVILLLSLDANSTSQTHFYPLQNSDTWVYWEYLQNAVGVWDTITVRVAGDTVIGGTSYKQIAYKNWRYNQHWLTIGRVDSSGDVYYLSGQESLSYRLSDTSRTWWHTDGYLARFDSCVVTEMFGRPRAVLYVGKYDTQDTLLRQQELLVDSIGFYTRRLFNIMYDGGFTVLDHGWIGGRLFGVDPFAPPPVSFPLHPGDRWYYAGLPYPTDVERYTLLVAGDTVMPNGKRYAYMVAEGQRTREYYRQSGDSVFTYDIGQETEHLFLDFSRHPGDTVSSFTSFIAGTPDTTDITLESVDTYTLFGAARRAWTFSVNLSRRSVDDEYQLTVVDSLGVYSRSLSFGDMYTLQGAIIDGRVYGTIDGIAQGKEGPPAEFQLEQNWPNPWNPSTTIGYTVGVHSSPFTVHSTAVKLTVYDVLGREVALLVNERQAPGRYTVRFNGSRLASGVYLYRLQAGNYVETKRMLLLK